MIAIKRTKAQRSREAISRLYTTMQHLFIRGNYKPLGVSGEAMIEALQALEPEIYGSINDPEKIELNGLFYVFERLPQGIEECRDDEGSKRYLRYSHAFNLPLYRSRKNQNQ